MFAVGILTSACYSTAPTVIEEAKIFNSSAHNLPIVLKTDAEKKLYALLTQASHENWDEEQITEACQKFLKENGSKGWSFWPVLLGLIIGGVSASVIVVIAILSKLGNPMRR
ncbi:MAG: hypothetical protein EBZ77_17400 [Chitinophagia bacterium]|nr:hypothetical protein [Chitinophagia bacterium]